MFGRLLILLKKELIQLVKNPSMRLTLFVPPVMQLLVLGYAATLELKRVDFGVLDYSRSACSRQLIAEFAGSPTFFLHPPLANEQDLQRQINERKIQVAVVIPDSFARDMAGKKTPQVQEITDGRSANSAGLAAAYVQNIVSDFSLNEATVPPAVITSRAWYNPNYQARYFMAPAVLAMIALIDVMLINALALAKEREEGTFDQLRLTPVSTLELLTAKGLSSVLIGVCQLAVGLAVIRWWFCVPIRSPLWLIAALLIAFLFAAMGLGLLISVISRNLQQAILTTFAVILPFSMLSGLSTPIESMPEILRALTIINPLRHGVAEIPRCFLEGASLYDLRWSFLFLGGIALGTFCAANIIFHRQRRGG